MLFLENRKSIKDSQCLLFTPSVNTILLTPNSRTSKARYLTNYLSILILDFPTLEVNLYGPHHQVSSALWFLVMFSQLGALGRSEEGRRQSGYLFSSFSLYSPFGVAVSLGQRSLLILRWPLYDFLSFQILAISLFPHPLGLTLWSVLLLLAMDS